MTPCYEPFKNLLIVLENAFEVIVKDKNNIFLRKTTKNAKKWGKTPFFPTAGGLPTCPQGSVGGVFNRPDGWRTASGEVGHRDLWEQILWERESAGEELQVHYVPSHLGVHGNHQADALAEEGRQMHPYNQQGLPKRPRVEPMWADLGLEEMPSDMLSSGVSSNELSELEGGWGSEMDATSCSSEDTESTSGGSVSDTGSRQSGGSECSTEVSDNPYRKRRRGLGREA